MAVYKYAQYLERSDHQAFDTVHGPSQPVPHSGIYRCRGCGQSIAANAGDPLPPQNHGQHPAGTPIQWQLIVSTH